MASTAEDDAVEQAALPDADRQRRHRLFILSGRLVLLVVVVGIWETLARTGLDSRGLHRPAVEVFAAPGRGGAGRQRSPLRPSIRSSATLMAFVLGGVLALATALMLAVYPTVKELTRSFHRRHERLAARGRWSRCSSCGSAWELCRRSFPAYR